MKNSQKVANPFNQHPSKLGDKAPVMTLLLDTDSTLYILILCASL